MSLNTRLRGALNRQVAEEQGYYRPSLFQNEPLVDYGNRAAAIAGDQVIRPNVLKNVLNLEDSSQIKAAQRNAEDPYRNYEVYEALQDVPQSFGRIDGQFTNAPKRADEFRRNLDDPQAQRETAERVANNLILQQLAGASAIGAGVGGVGLIANATQGDSNGNLLVNPVTTGALGALGAGAGAGYLARQTYRDDPSFYYGLPADINDRGKRERKLNRHNKVVAGRRNQRGFRAGAATAGAVTLMNLISALRDEE